MSKFDIEIKKPKDQSYCEEALFNGLYVNAGYKSKKGIDVACEKIALVSLFEQIKHVKSAPGYRWNAAHIRFSMVPKKDQELPGKEELAISGHKALQAAKMAIKKRYPNAKIHYRWHLEHSPDAGWHYHVAIFTNGNQLIGTRAIETELHAYGVHSLESIKPDFSRMREGEARDYFLSQGLEVDSSLNYLPLKNEIDFEYALYWFSYMTKRATKEAVSRSTGGTQLK